MFAGMNPKDVQKAMKRLGIRQEEIDAQEVIIRTPDKDLVIKNPHVSKVNMMGNETFQISGEITEVEKNEAIETAQALETTEDDVSTVVGQTSCSRQEALQALEESNGNLAEAILKLQNR